METPYITRSRQPAPTPEKPGKAELFKPDSEQSRRSLILEMVEDFESHEARKNLRALGTLQNMNILEIRDGKSTGLEKVTAPIPGLEAEKSLKDMIEDGLVKPSSSMMELADRHGLSMPEARKDGPNPFRKENAPDLLTSVEPTGPLQNPGLRELTGSLADQAQANTRDKSQAIQDLEKAFGTILNPTEKTFAGIGTQEPKKDEGPVMPWLKPKTKEEEKNPEIDPIGMFNDAAKSLQKLNPQDQEETLSQFFGKIADTMSKNMESKKPFLLMANNPVQTMANMLLVSMADTVFKDAAKLLSGDKNKENLLQKMVDADITPMNMFLDPLGTTKKGMGIIMGEVGEKAPELKDKANSVKKKFEDPQGQPSVTEFITDPTGSLQKMITTALGPVPKEKGTNKEPNKEGSQETPSTYKGAQPPPLPGASKAVGKTTDTLTTRTTPAMEGVKAGIEIFKEAASDKSLPDKMAGMAKGAGKVIVNMAKGAGTKALAGAMGTPAAPVAAVLMVVAVTAKLAMDALMGAMLPNEGKPVDPEKKETSNQKEDSKTGEKTDYLEVSINTLMPNAGGKKGLAMKGITKGAQAAGGAVKRDLSGEANKAAEEQQKSSAPEIAL